MNENLIVQKPLATPLPWWQKRAFTISVALLALLFIITIMTINVAKYETHLATGDTVLLELAPVDPRGFMQGDYMALRYALEDEVFAALNQGTNTVSRDSNLPSNLVSDDGYIIVALDKNNVGQFVRLANHNEHDSLAANEMAIHYRVRNGTMKLATNAFFFQEGHAKAYEAAEYGLFRVNEQGEPLLTDMVNNKFEVIEAEAEVEVEDNEIKEMQIDKAP